MKLKHLKKTQFLPLSLDEAWAFFSSPYNLNTITPDDLSFEILSDVKEVEMYPGMLIQYRLKPMLNIPVHWVTEITQVKDRTYFIDEQRSGPYAFWHHEHHFKPIANGVEMIDLLYYAAPLGWLGKCAESLFIDNKVKGIFDYRYQKLIQLFPYRNK